MAKKNPALSKTKKGEVSTPKTHEVDVDDVQRETLDEENVESETLEVPLNVSAEDIQEVAFDNNVVRKVVKGPGKEETRPDHTVPVESVEEGEKLFSFDDEG